MQQQSYRSVCGKMVLIQRKLGLKRMTLRFSKRQKAFVVSVPVLVPFSSVTRFIDGAQAWFAKVDLYYQQQRLQQQSISRVIEPGQLILVLGKLTRIDFIPSPKPMVSLNGTILEVHGVRSKFEQLLITYLKKLAYEKFSYYSHEYAQALGVRFKKITVKEMKTRFGSCTSIGSLNYCWRLIFAPEPVLAYLCAHEVSHLKEMNHSKKFWDYVAFLCPDYKNLQKWLKQNGKGLFGAL